MSSNQKLLPYIHVDGQKWAHYFFDPKTNVIYFEKRHNGKRVKFSTKERVPDGVKAKRFANAEFDRRIGKKKNIVRSLIREEMDLFLKVKEAEGLDYDTMNNIRRACRQNLEFWGDMLPSDITADTVTEWYSWWSANNPKIQMENTVKYFKTFCKYLSQKVVGGMPLLAAVPKIGDPNARANRRKRKQKKELIFSSNDFSQIYHAASCLEEQLICLFMYTMASRITETLEMSFGQEILLQHSPPIYRWRDGQNKADIDGFHALHPSLLTPLYELLALRVHQGTKRLFPQKIDNQAPMKSQQIDFKAWGKRANIGWHWTSHTFRHTCLSNLFNDPNNPQLLICKLYRISMKEAEETYVKPTQAGIERMRNAIEVSV